MGCIVLNDPALASGAAGADVGETLGARMLGAAAVEQGILRDNARRPLPPLRPFLLRYLDAGPAPDTLVAGASPCRAWRQYDSALRPEPAE